MQARPSPKSDCFYARPSTRATPISRFTHAQMDSIGSAINTLLEKKGSTKEASILSKRKGTLKRIAKEKKDCKEKKESRKEKQKLKKKDHQPFEEATLNREKELKKLATKGAVYLLNQIKWSEED
eukprot:GHVN01049896.1.p2 GENE.GHVN01049896.1~~GHVN01049896.1.p2  ORF type:complete len:125 (+),score=22.73 GHVN01049896.1:950-1324(+)